MRVDAAARASPAAGLSRSAARRCLLCLCLWGAGLGGGCAPEGRPPHVLLVVVDTLRADRLGSYGGSRGLTPFLDELAARGTRFENAYAPSSWTSPSVASLLTSRHPIEHRVTGFDSVLAPSESTLAERLAAQGYRTAGFSANARLRAELGYGQGFDAWEVLEAPQQPGGGVPKLRAPALSARALDWLDTARSRSPDRPIFLYLQYMEPHTPYEPPPALRRRYGAPGATPAAAAEANRIAASLHFSDLSAQQVAMLASLYDGEVAALDAALRELFAGLERRGFLDGGYAVVTADHGEELREHGAMLHGLTLFEAGLRVPLLIVGPGVEPGRVVRRNVSLLDVVPTLLELLGLPRDARLEGHSLVSLLRGPEPPATREGGPDLLFELASKRTAVDLRSHRDGLLRGSRKLLRTPGGGAIVYDLARDPDEAAPGPDSPELEQAIERTRAALASRAAADAASLPLDAATREELKALGYAVDPAP